MMKSLKIKTILIVKNKSILADKCFVADSFLSRLKGLLGEKGLNQGEGLFLTPCRDIHMWFMKFPIDVAFVEKISGNSYRVTSTRENLRPWHPLPVGDRHATDTLEMPVGTIRRFQVAAGDELCIS